MCISCSQCLIPNFVSSECTEKQKSYGKIGRTLRFLGHFCLLLLTCIKGCTCKCIGQLTRLVCSIFFPYPPLLDESCFPTEYQMKNLMCSEKSWWESPHLAYGVWQSHFLAFFLSAMRKIRSTPWYRSQQGSALSNTRTNSTI